MAFFGILDLVLPSRDGREVAVLYLLSVTMIFCGSSLKQIAVCSIPQQARVLMPCSLSVNLIPNNY